MGNSTRLEHVAIAVSDLEAAVELYRAMLGRAESGREEIEAEQVRAAFFDLGGSRLELLEATQADSPVGRFIDRHGPGIHHIALEVEDLELALQRCRAAGMETVGRAPRQGASGRSVAFLHPKGTGGILIELSQAAG